MMPERNWLETVPKVVSKRVFMQQCVLAQVGLIALAPKELAEHAKEAYEYIEKECSDV